MFFLCMLSIYMIIFLTVFIFLLSATYGILLLVPFSRVYQVLLDLFSYIFSLTFHLLRVLVLLFYSMSEFVCLCMCIKCPLLKIYIY